MNKWMLRKMRGQQVLLWPPVQSLYSDGRIEERELWPSIVRDEPRNTLPLQLVPSGHFFDLPFDNINQFRENLPGRHPYLLLHARVWITAWDVALKHFDWRPTRVVAASGRLH